MAASVEAEKPSAPPRRWLAFLDCRSVDELPDIQPTTASAVNSSARAISEDYNNGITEEVRTVYAVQQAIQYYSFIK